MTMTTSDILWSIGTFFACLGAVLIILESLPRRKRSHLHLLMRDPHKSPGKPHQSSDRNSTGKDMSRGFFYGTSTPVNPKTMTRDAMKYQSKWSHCPPIGQDSNESQGTP